MNSLDPSYLRYIYDGIFNGVIASDNESTLPEGLVGLYEDAFLENIPVYRRQQSLEVFACWALLKKEASILFVSEILQVDETEVFELVGTYSSWFNSPEPGKYTLYHERLRIYFLQKLGEKEVQRLNQRLIARLQKAIAEQLKDEFEIYALEFLSDHLVVEAFADVSKGKELLGFTKDESIWNRQIKVSNQFTWSKNTIQKTILWTAKYQPKETVFGYLDLVELNYKEQNDAENIVAFVANNEIDLAMKRIETFGGADQEGLQRKFTLYMLCLMELTLLESKSQVWRKVAIEKIVKHFNEKMPIKNYNWDSFISSYLVFQIVCELKKLGLDFIQIFEGCNFWDTEWINEKGPYNTFEMDVLLNIGIFNNGYGLTYIARQLYYLSDFDNAILISNKISDKDSKSNILNDISLKLYKNGDVLKAIKCLKSSPSPNSVIIEILLEVFKSSLKIQLKTFFCLIFSKFSLRSLFFYLRFKFSNKNKKNIEFIIRKQSVFKRGKLNWRHSDSVKIKEYAEFFDLEKILIYEGENYLNLGKIALEMAKKNKLEADELLLIAIIKSIQIIEKNDRVKSIRNLTSLYSEGNKMKEVFEILNFSLEYNREIDKLQKCNLIDNVSIKLAKNEFLIESIISAQFIPNFDNQTLNNKKNTFNTISKELISQSKWHELILKCNDNFYKSHLFQEISIEFYKKGEIAESAFAIEEAYTFANKIVDESEKESMKFHISYQLVNLGNYEEAMKYTEDGPDLDRIIIYIVSKLVELGKIDEALTYKSKYPYEDYFMESIVDDIARNFNLSDTLEYLKLISDDKRDSVLSTLGYQLIDKGKVEESYECFNLITDPNDKDWLLQQIGSFLAKEGRLDEAKTYLDEFSEPNGLDKFWVMQEIALQLVNQNKIKEAIDYSKEIYKDYNDKFDYPYQVRVLESIALHHAKNGDWKFSESIVSEIVKTDNILNCLKSIAVTLIKDKGVLYSLESNSNYQNKEFQKYYLKGWAENIGINELTNEILLKAIPLFKNDQDSLNHLLQTHAINELFFGEASTDEIQKYNRTLNIQWAIDIKQQIDSNSY